MYPNSRLWKTSENSGAELGCNDQLKEVRLRSKSNVSPLGSAHGWPPHSRISQDFLTSLIEAASPNRGGTVSKISVGIQSNGRATSGIEKVSHDCKVKIRGQKWDCRQEKRTLTIM